MGKFGVVGIAGRALADQAGLGGDKPQMGLVSSANGLEQRETCFDVC